MATKWKEGCLFDESIYWGSFVVLICQAFVQRKFIRMNRKIMILLTQISCTKHFNDKFLWIQDELKSCWVEKIVHSFCEYLFLLIRITCLPQVVHTFSTNIFIKSLWSFEAFWLFFEKKCWQFTHIALDVKWK